ncbi:MAG: metal-dependent transcriptional regulator [Peptococcaceae bacterium]|nr:metal-dependent transcriptional regulator [Peptococcaceae bacterium]
MALHKSGEDYLETILMLEEKNGYVRSVDVAAALGFSKPSISRAMTLLKEQNYITMDRDRLIRLTETGRVKANEVYGRHKALTRYFVEVLGVEETVAEADACNIEHVISRESMEKMIAHLSALNRA